MDKKKIFVCMSAMINLQYARTRARAYMRTKVRLNGETSDKYSTFYLEQIPHPGANLQKANARPWEQVQLKMPDKRPGGGMGSHGID
jgi:hypothetical protein